MITTIVILSIITCLLIFSNINMLKKYEKLEDYVDDADAWVDGLQKSLNDLLNDWDRVDRKGAFKTDDEVGTTYEQIKNLIKKLNDGFGTK